eukprot:Pompholyxophrys_punicea_v1_NODE_277_length_2406_cov_4.192684.p2 type:complete len:159 gc:universal NODE_277_length_2406_cov_4.192684:1870-2346(+)
MPGIQQVQVLKKFALMVMQLVPHSARVEQLFSSLSLIKTKSRNRMSVTTLKVLGQVQEKLRGEQQNAKEKQKKLSRTEEDVESTAKLNDIFEEEEETDELAFEEFLTSEDPETGIEGEDIFSKYFDWQAFEKIASAQNEVQKTTQTNSTSLDWNLDDI